MRILIILAFIICSKSLFAQGNLEKDSIIYYPLREFVLNNKELSLILDSILLHEKKCSYYSKSLLFSVNIQCVSTTEFIIESFGENALHLPNEYGCFIYKEHLFFILSNEDKINEEFFIPTVKSKLIKFNQSLYGWCEKEDTVFFGKNLSTDDSYSMWIYEYINNKFIFVDKSTLCK